MAAEDVASAVCRVAIGSPLNGTVEIGGPEKFRLDELVRRTLASRKDPPGVVAEPQAPYYGVKVSETTLLPGSDVRLGIRVSKGGSGSPQTKFGPRPGTLQ